MNKLFSHLKDWPEFYLAIPAVLLALPGAAYFCYILSGRAPQENLSWLMDLDARVIQAALAILSVSVARQSFGTWATKEEKLANPIWSTGQSILTLCALLAFLHFFSH